MLILKNQNLNSRFQNRRFILFLASQGISALAESFQLVSVAMLLNNLSGSGISAGFIVVCAPIVSIVLSPFAGSLGDRSNEKNALFLLSILRCAAVLMFIYSRNIWMMYIFLLIFSGISIIYNPISKKMMVNLLKEDELAVGNGLINGFSGGAYLVGPVISGIILDTYGPYISLILSGIMYLLSGFLIMGIKGYKLVPAGYKGCKTQESIAEGFDYYKKSSVLKEIIVFGTVICLGTSAANLAFYPFAFDLLKVSGKLWGLILSIFYGTSIISMLLSIVLNRIIFRFPSAVLSASAIILSAAWLMYSSTDNIQVILYVLIMEGTAASFSNILLTTLLQIKSSKAYISRVASINDFINSIGKIVGICMTYLLLACFSVQTVFVTCSILLMVYSLYKIVGIKSAKRGY